MIGDYYLRAIALTILSLAIGSLIVSASWWFITESASTYSSAEAAKFAANIGTVAMVVGSLVAATGVISAFGHYRTAAALQNPPNPVSTTVEHEVPWDEQPLNDAAEAILAEKYDDPKKLMHARKATWQKLRREGKA